MFAPDGANIEVRRRPAGDGKAPPEPCIDRVKEQDGPALCLSDITKSKQRPYPYASAADPSGTGKRI